MIVLVLTAVPPGLRGDLSRWLTEIAPGVFCGRVSRRVRDHLWDRVGQSVRDGSAVLVAASADREQGYEIRACGARRRLPVDFDGLTLMERPRRPRGETGGNSPHPRRRTARRRRRGLRPWAAAWKRLRDGAEKRK
jgi:CRISPR-associated protein Cas2